MTFCVYVTELYRPPTRRALWRHSLLSLMATSTSALYSLATGGRTLLTPCGFCWPVKHARLLLRPWAILWLFSSPGIMRSDVGPVLTFCAAVRPFTYALHCAISYNRDPELWHFELKIGTMVRLLIFCVTLTPIFPCALFEFGVGTGQTNRRYL